MASNGQGSRIVYSQSFVTGLTGTDLYGHGTHVAGIVGANGANSTGPGFTRTFNGMAPNVNLINLQVLDQNGSGTDSNVIAALDEAITLQEHRYNIRVINLSLGRAVFESYKVDPICQAAEAAWSSGIVVVAAARELRTQCRGWPSSLWHHRFAWQRSVCDHRWRDQHPWLYQRIG